MVAFALEFRNSHTAVVPGEARLADAFPDAVLRVAGHTPAAAVLPVHRQAGGRLQRSATPPKGKGGEESESEFGTKEMQDFVRQRQLQLERQLQALGGRASRSSRSKPARPGGGGAAGAESRGQHGPRSGDDMAAFIFG